GRWWQNFVRIDDCLKRWHGASKAHGHLAQFVVVAWLALLRRFGLQGSIGCGLMMDLPGRGAQVEGKQDQPALQFIVALAEGKRLLLARFKREAGAEYKIALKMAERNAVVIRSANAMFFALKNKRFTIRFGCQIAAENGGDKPRELAIKLHQFIL